MWIRCPMGICNDPATFQRAMNMAFQNFVRKKRLTQSIINYCVIVYMDDILVYSSSYEGHVQHIEWALHALRDAGFKVALEKFPLLDPRHRLVWRETFVDLSMCLVRVKVTWMRTDEHQEWIEYLELLIIQAWRTDVEGDLLGFLFGSMRPGHRQPTVQELIVPLAQLVDLSLDIVSQSDASPAPHVLTRTLDPYLQWTACLEEPGSGVPPSQQENLKPYGIINRARYPLRDPSEEAAGEEEESTEEEVDAEEETPEEGKYSEHSEGEQSEEEEEEVEDDEEEAAGSEWEALPEEAVRTGTEVEDPEAARKKEEITDGKPKLEFASGASLRIHDDPSRDPEPPRPEDGDLAATAPSALRRRRSRSSSPSTPARPPVRPRTDAGDRPSSPVVIPPSA
ncbi:hypothetical protein CBR_g8067 [Chara braunii]|uniref:Reverse transcriptase domain-containing protein n=1 Tax=Chara braunii TaxID=69332 RepID=A0A388KL32_CHABU|nr:hypothetical protein CBR_g8067 [Chara braunii]|eukprot:GBG70769.1 hypothetical protein CBR_g8067 [Chara braunii]